MVGLIILIALVAKIGPSNIVNSLFSVNIFYLVLAVIMILPILCLQTVKLKMLLSSQNIILPFWYIFKLHLIGLFYGSITPGKLGSFIKVVYLKKKTNKGTGECAPAVLFDKLFDLIPVGILAVLGTFFVVRRFFNIQIEIVLIFAGLILATVVLVNKGLRTFFVEKVFKFIIPKTIEGEVVSFSDNIPHWSRLIRPFLLGCVVWILIYTQLYFFSRTFLINVPYLSFIILFPIATLVGLIPITIAGLGTREATAIILFSIFLVPPEKIISMSIVALSFTYLQSLIGGIFSIRKEM